MVSEIRYNLHLGYLKNNFFMKIKSICCIGAGYVGGPTMAVIALKCPHINVIVVDNNSEKINAWNGSLEKLPVYEPGLKNIIKKVRGRNLFFSNDVDNSIKKSEIIFMAVNTPTKKQGSGAGMAADLTYVEACARKIAEVSTSDKIIVEKSTLPVRTAEKIKEILSENSSGLKFEIISNPEFLAEGTAIEDLFKSDRVLIGGDQTDSGKAAVDLIVDIYKNWIPENKILKTNVWSSELSKLASNAMLAQRISSINSLSALCEKTGADIDEVSLAVGMDSRIGKEFLKASVGFGGSCFKKDILNLVYLSKYYGLDDVARYWNQVIKINNFQKSRFSKKVIDELNGTIRNKKITILGWAFKKNTNDSRESAAIEIADTFLNEGANISVYDPMVREKTIKEDMKELWINSGDSHDQIVSKSKQINIYNNAELAVNGSYCVCIITEWDEFRDYDWENLIKMMKKPSIIMDGRNIINKTLISKYTKKFYSIGK